MNRDSAVGVIIAIVLLAASVGALIVMRDSDVAVEPIPQSQGVEQSVEAATPPADVVNDAPAFDSAALQTALDEWSSGMPADAKAGIYISDVNGNMLAQSNPDEVYFAASIYKLYVAYEGYRAVDDGRFNANDSYSNGRTLGECLDVMIRESDSPCAEKMWGELGKEELNDILSDYGLKNTDMVSLSTSAADAAIILQRIANGEGLSGESQAAFLASMKDQIYDAMFDAGFSESITVFNKIGFRDNDEYHDVAIVEVSPNKLIIISALTDGVGTALLRELAVTIEGVL